MFLQGSQRPWRGLPGVLSIAEVSAASPPFLPHCTSEAFALGGPRGRCQGDPTEELGFSGRQTHTEGQIPRQQTNCVGEGLARMQQSPRDLVSSSLVFLPHSDAESPFIEMHSDIPKLVNMSEGRELIIPCRVTSPNITVTLKKVKLQRCSCHSLASNGCRFTHKEDVYNQAQ